MLKYDNYAITFSEFPNEISLYITITNCPIHCPGCNSKHLWKDTGKKLDWSSLNALIHSNNGITAVCLGGGDNSPKEIDKLAWHIKRSTNLKVCWYSGQDSISKYIDVRNFDAIKIGHFNGIPINNPDTNQRFYNLKCFDGEDGEGCVELIDNTKLFWK